MTRGALSKGDWDVWGIGDLRLGLGDKCTTRKRRCLMFSLRKRQDRNYLLVLQANGIIDMLARLMYSTDEKLK